MAKEQDLYFKLGEIHGDIKSILDEAKRTNGRVTRLESEVNSIRVKIAYYTGGFAVVIFVIEKIINYYT